MSRTTLYSESVSKVNNAKRKTSRKNSVQSVQSKDLRSGMQTGNTKIKCRIQMENKQKLTSSSCQKCGT